MASGQITRLAKHTPLIKFVGSRPKISFDPHSVNETKTESPKRIVKDVPSDLPQRWHRKPLSQQEIDIITSGGVQS